MDRDFKWIWIPKEIWLADDINIMCKILLVEIDSLSTEDEWCYASNEYFSNFFWISTTQVSKYISLLKEKWYIEEVSFNWRKRVLKSCFSLELKKTETPTSKQPLTKVKGRVEEKLKHNNIVYNTLLSKDNNSDEVANKTQAVDVDDFTKGLSADVEDKMLSARDKEKGFYEVWNLIPTWRAWWNKNNWQKAFLKKLDEWFSVEDMKKCALLAKLELREKAQDYNYTMKKENRLTNLCKISDEEMELRIIWILKARYERYLKWTKFQHNSVAELCDMFWSDYVNWLRKDIQKEYKQHF